MHHDLFEVIKKAIPSSDDSEAIGEVESKEPFIVDTNEANADAGETESATIKPPLMFDGIFRQIIASFSHMTPTQQLAIFVAIFLVGSVIFSRNDPRASDDLAHKVDELTIEIREVKVLLERILNVAERKSLKLVDLGENDE